MSGPFVLNVLSVVSNIGLLVFILTRIYALKTEISNLHVTILNRINTSEEKLRNEFNKRIDENEDRILVSEQDIVNLRP